MKQKWHGGIHGAEMEVLKFEALKRETAKLRSMKKLLKPITDIEITRTQKRENTWMFTDNTCGLIRRLESAAWVYEGKGRKEIKQAYKRLKRLLPTIKAMQNRIALFDARNEINYMGQQFVLYKLKWARRILTKSLPAWGYK